MSRTIPFAFALLAACGGGNPPPATARPACGLTVDALPGKTFVELEVLGDKSEKPNPQARMQFRKEDGGLRVRYTVKNALHSYDYTCSDGGRENELKCVTKPDFKRVCLAFEVHGDGSCTAEAMEKAGLSGPAEEVAKGIEEAKKLVAEAKASPQWKQFQLINNNVGNTLQGQLFVKVDTKRCRLQVDDMFVTIFNGKRTEDFNPVGSNPFVESTDTLLFDDCEREGMLVDLDAPELPADLSTVPRVREHAVGRDVHYHYAGEATAEEGCTYAMDTWANWRPAGKDLPAAVAGGKVVWHATHSWKADDLLFVGADAGQPLRGGFFHMTRYKTCGGTKDRIDTVCNAARVVPAAVAGE